MLPDPRPYSADLEGPRRETRNKLHKLSDILMIVFCAVLAGIEDWVGMEDFALEEEVWFRGFLEPPNGIPSHDTLGRVLGRLKPEPFAAAFLEWAQAALPSLSGEQVCLDGKTLRGSRSGGGTIHLVSAYANQARMVLAQQAVAEKSNEITAIPNLLSLLDLRGATVAIDAMGCQKAIARQVVEAGGDYVLALKDNHPTLCEEVGLWLDTEVSKGRLPQRETTEKDHGRIEIRRYSLSDAMGWLESKSEWTGLRAVGRVESLRIVDGKTTTELRCFLCSHTDLPRFAGGVRGHWGIENGRHWVLDVQFGEDANRARKGHSGKNLALVRRMALSLLRHNDPTSKQSIRRRKRRAILNKDYRNRLIFGDQRVPTS